MAGNTIGISFRLTSFGESHGPAIGGVVDGCPSGIAIDFDLIDHELRRRKTGVHDYTSSRKEDDSVEFLSGMRFSDHHTVTLLITKNISIGIIGEEEEVQPGKQQ